MATVALVVLWSLAVIGAGSGEVFDPAWARAPAFVGWTWLGVGFYISLGLLVMGIVLLMARLTRRLRPRTSADSPQSSGLRGIRFATAGVVVLAMGVSAYGLTVASRPQVVQAEAVLTRLPTEFDGIRVALVSDLHVGPSRGVEFTQRVVDLVNSERPDLILVAGDLVDGTVAMVAPDLAPLSQLSAPLDVWDRLGIRTLRNERATISRGGAQIDIAGIHDYSSPSPYEPDLPAALAGRDASRLLLLLAHEPRQAWQASDLGVNLQLSGHTHGGQMWPINYLVALQQPQVDGLGAVGDTTIYTTRGVGTWARQSGSARVRK